MSKTVNIYLSFFKLRNINSNHVFWDTAYNHSAGRGGKPWFGFSEYTLTVLVELRHRLCDVSADASVIIPSYSDWRR